jgi:hypothetical protein
METVDIFNSASPRLEGLDVYEHSFLCLTMARMTPEQSRAYDEGRRNGVLAGIMLGAFSAAIMALLLWLIAG